MIFEILAATMLVINLAAVVLTLSAIGHLHTRVADNARFQSVLFRKSLVAISENRSLRSCSTSRSLMC